MRKRNAGEKVCTHRARSVCRGARCVQIFLRDSHKTVSPYIKCHRREVLTMANATYSQNDPLGGAPDYARYDRIWQRVAPALDPYPQVRCSRAQRRERRRRRCRTGIRCRQDRQSRQAKRGRLRHQRDRWGAQALLWRRSCSCPALPRIPAAWGLRHRT